VDHYAESDKDLWLAVWLLESISISSAIVHFQVLQCLDEKHRPAAPRFTAPGMLAAPPSWDEAGQMLLNVLFLCRNDILAISCDEPETQAELAEAVMIAEALEHRREAFATERDNKDKGDLNAPTRIQRMAWLALANFTCPVANLDVRIRRHLSRDIPGKEPASPKTAAA
jgi:hypothetical protein